MNDYLLVSVCVITYNSAKYVQETLDSIYRQTYANIEVIVSDDGSKDNTIDLVSKWLKDHKTRFVNATVLTVEKNTGTAANINRGLKASSGTWVKFIAGDDILLDDGVEKLMLYINEHPEAKWVYANSLFYRERFEENCIIKNDYEHLKSFFNDSAKNQLKRILIGNPFVGPGHIFNRALLDKIGGYDEEFGILEDYPMWFKMLGRGIKSYYLDDNVAGYRVETENNVCANAKLIVNKKMSKLRFGVGKKYVFGKYPLRYKWNFLLKNYIDVLFSLPILNRRDTFFLSIYKFLYGVINYLFR